MTSETLPPARRINFLGRACGVSDERVARWGEAAGSGREGAGWSRLALDVFTSSIGERHRNPRSGVDNEFGFAVGRIDRHGMIGKHGGRQSVVVPEPEWRASTCQLPGLWPWPVGAAAPIVGTPLGSHLRTGAPVCFDAYNWFEHGRYISNPSTFVMGLPGFGKSTLARRMVIGKVAQGITPLVLGDLKPDYVDLVRELGGQVVSVGDGVGRINPLDVGSLGSILPLLEQRAPALIDDVWQQIYARQVIILAGLIQIVRGGPVADFEETVLSSALKRLYTGSGFDRARYSAESFSPSSPPVVSDLGEVIFDGDEDMIADAAADDLAEYRTTIKPLRRALRALARGPFGAVFNGQTTVRLDTSASSVCVDVSAVGDDSPKLMGAVLLTCWSDGFACVEAQHILERAGLAARRNFCVVLDEMWRVLGAGVGMVDRVNALSRLNRQIGLELIQITHTFKDLRAVKTEEDRQKAIGLIERAGALIVGALPRDEMVQLAEVKPFTAAEIEMVSGWSSTTAMMTEAPRRGAVRHSPPGQGNFLIKIGEAGRAGVPFRVQLTPTEMALGVHNTNKRFEE
ncbi:hypothetical protein [Corynebacterium sp. CCM 9203]|uniref:hypothetical protein n=1 Tax=Corynebacterium sp. CCM 9203 TaxID=3057615 RepID=UPI00352488C6